MNIPHYYRKFSEKSRSLFADYISGRRINLFLFITAIIVLALIAVNQTCRTANTVQRIDITISPQAIHLFGRDTMNALIQEFEEQNPGLRIQVAAQDAPGSAADIVFFDDIDFRGLLTDTYIHTETLVSFLDVFIYNIDILQAANCDRPPKTRAEFLAAARAIAENNAVPFALGLSQADPAALRRDFYPWVWVSGGDIHSADISRQMTDVIAFFELLNREKLLAPGTFEKTGAQRLEEFARGKIAMMTVSARDIAFLRQQGINFDITAVPAAAHGKNRLGLSKIYAGINGDCALPDEALIFLAFIAEKSHLLAETLGAVPGSFPGVFSGEYIAEDTLYSKAWDIFQMAEIVEYKPGQPFEEEMNLIIRERLIDRLTRSTPYLP